LIKPSTVEESSLRAVRIAVAVAVAALTVFLVMEVLFLRAA